MKFKWNILIMLVLLCGCGILFYPVISNWFAVRNHTQVIEAYQVTAGQMLEEERQKEKERAVAYNDTLKGTQITDPFATAEETDPEYLSILNIQGIIGYISIPVIDVNLPVYHTTGEEVLKKGAGHMEYSAFPVGGAGNHTILTAHRGLPSAKLFTDLDRLEEGDQFRLHVLDETLVYRVEEVLIAEPDNTEALYPVEGKDYVTLVTCTPYAVNSHRMFVRGIRDIEAEQEGDTERTEKRALRGRLFWLICILTGSFTISVSVYRRKHR